MDSSALVSALATPAAYPHAPKRVEVRQTHISRVFLAGPFVYKVKKPLALGFLDYSTLEKRHHFCEEEVRLNRRLAPEAYLGVVPITQQDGVIRVESSGEVIEWAVKMVHLPDDARLSEHVKRGAVGAAFFEDLGRKLVAFHTQAERGPRISAFGRFEVVAGNALENFEQAANQVGTTVSRAVFERLHALVQQALADLRGLIERRALRGVPCDTHGDLRLDHVYVFPDRPPPNDLAIIDCIEFNERFRCADPVADMAFLTMDLASNGHRDLAQAFSDAYFHAATDEEGKELLPFYASYRAAVRGKVEGIKQGESEVPATQRAMALDAARGSWLLALEILEQPARRPCLVLVGGLPGTGKSTLAAGLAQRASFTVIRSDVVRKQLAGLANNAPAASSFEQGIYTPEWTARTYDECLRRAQAALFEGKRVLVDASFRDDAQRLRFLEAAARWSVSALFFVCTAHQQAVQERLARRQGDPSDADWTTHQQTSHQWQDPGPSTRPVTHEIDTSSDTDKTIAGALEILRACDLFQ
jgi:uncharacterized protein